MGYVNVHEAKTHLSRYIDAVESGAETEIVIARNGKPAARLVPFTSPKQEIRYGLAAGNWSLPDDFDRDNDLIQALFEGRPSG
jgi:prevent-host-death family protein